jgi:hypothetical protein
MKKPESPDGNLLLRRDDPEPYGNVRRCNAERSERRRLQNASVRADRLLHGLN